MRKKLKTILLTMFAAALLLGGCGSSPADNGIPADVSADAAIVAQLATEFCEAEYDDYFSYYTPDEYRLLFADYQGSFGGVGVSMTLLDDEIVVFGVLTDTPAADSPITAGDVIIAVDGKSVVGCDTSEAALLIRGDVGSKVTITLRNSDKREYDVTLTRAVITTTTVMGEFIEELPGVAFIAISEFTEQTPVEFVDTFNKMLEEQKITALILDLRSNGGGSFQAAINIAQFFVPGGHMIVTEKTADGTIEYPSTSGQLTSLPIVVLQNFWTASASEVLLGALRDEADAVLVGDTSFGKGITQAVEELKSGAALKYTRSRYYTPSGFDLHGVGVEPDIVSPTPDDITSVEYFSTDPAINPQLQAALDYLKANILP